MVVLAVPSAPFLPSHLLLSLPRNDEVSSKAFMKSRKHFRKGAETDLCVSLLKDVHRNGEFHVFGKLNIQNCLLSSETLSCLPLLFLTSGSGVVPQTKQNKTRDSTINYFFPKFRWTHRIQCKMPKPCLVVVIDLGCQAFPGDKEKYWDTHN